MIRLARFLARHRMLTPKYAALGLRYESPEGSVLGFVARYRDNRYTDAENTFAGRLEKYGTVDAYFSAPLGGSRVFLEVWNLTDAEYFQNADEPMPGRTIFAGMTMSF